MTHRNVGADRRSRAALAADRLWGRAPLMALLACVAAGVLASPASATKYFDSFFGTTGSGATAVGGTFSTPRDIVVNDPTVNDGNGGAYDGWIYIVDQSNNRIQAFNSARVFQFAIGRDVNQTAITAAASQAERNVCPRPGNPGDVCRGGSTGALGSEFNVAQGIDVDQATGHLFVRERNNNRRVQEFGPGGSFVRAWGWNVVVEGTSGDTASDQFETCFVAAECQGAAVAGAALGQFGSSTANSTGIAVAPPGAPDAGDIFVVDPGGSSLTNRRVLRFDVPLNPTSPVVPMTAIGGSATFGPVGSTQCEHPRHLAIDANGVMHASSAPTCGAGHSLARYDLARGLFIDAIPAVLLGNGAINALAVGSDANHLLVAAGAGLQELDQTGAPAQVTSSNIVDNHAPGLIASSAIVPNGVAVNRGSGELFLTTATGPAASGTGSRVVVLDDSGVDPVPTVNPLPAEGVDATSATLRADINPNGPTGFPTSYRFQLSKDGIIWTDVTSNSVVGDSGSSVIVDDVIEGLEANTLYRFRVRTQRDPAAGVTISSELTFVTDAAPPVVYVDGAAQVTDDSALLAGRVNPNGLSTRYWFEWGDNHYGNTVPLPAGDTGGGSVLKTVREGVSGLEAERLYHFRFCAENALVAEAVCSDDRTFTTRSRVEALAGRGYEMVTSPDKTLRRGGERGMDGTDLGRFQGALPAPDGNSAMWRLFAGVTDPEAGSGFAWSDPYELRSRTSSGWTGESTMKIVPPFPVASGTGNLIALSEDLDAQFYYTSMPLFSSMSTLATHQMNDTGGPRSAGWYPTLDPAWTPSAGIKSYTGADGFYDDRGDVLLASSSSSAKFRDVTPTDGGAAADSLSSPQSDGHALVRYDAPDWLPTDLINECTGSIDDGDATELLVRDDGGTSTGPSGNWTAVGTLTSGSAEVTGVTVVSGTPQVSQLIAGAGVPVGTTVTAVGAGTLTMSNAATASGSPVVFSGQQNASAANNDTIQVRACEAGSPTHVRGGSALFGDGGRLNSGRMNVVSENGDRVFFASPDPATSVDTGSGLAGHMDCAVASLTAVYTGPSTECPAQLFVRQYDDEGDATVRWISRAEDELFNGPGDGGVGPQSIGQVGNGVAFEGASNDGRVVYFRTNAPLTTDDPNSLTSITAGSASSTSWDLYRYELPASNDADPADGELTRISGGPGATADPNTNCSAAAADCGGTSNGSGGVARFVSDGGDQVYFVTTSRIGAAGDPWNAPPAGGATVAGGSATGNVATRNLYKYDATASGADAYRFIARVPYGAANDLDDLASCASSNAVAGDAVRDASGGGGGAGVFVRGNCVRGTSSGDAIVFETTGQLTSDDNDAAGDVYLYDATAEELVRLSAPREASDAYSCVSVSATKQTTAWCNGDLGFRGGYNGGDGGVGANVGVGAMRHRNLAEDSQGRLTGVFFESRLRLVGEDVNEGRMDVYEWRRGDGDLSLISPGGTDDSAFYTGNSRDGGSVFFWTEQMIDPREIDTRDGDLYVARRAGGFPPPPSPPTVCAVLVNGCHGPGGSELAMSVASRAAGDGDQAAGQRTVLSMAVVSRRTRAVAARRGVVALRVRVSQPSRVSVSARATLGGKARLVARRSIRAREAGVVVVRLRLSRAAVDRLRTGRRLTLAVTAASAGAHDRTVRVNLARGRR